MRSESNSASGQGDRAFRYVAAELSGHRWDVQENAFKGPSVQGSQGVVPSLELSPGSSGDHRI